MDQELLAKYTRMGMRRFTRFLMFLIVLGAIPVVSVVCLPVLKATHSRPIWLLAIGIGLVFYAALTYHRLPRHAKRLLAKGDMDAYPFRQSSEAESLRSVERDAKDIPARS
ncbi:hypothetical protein EON81_15645 [bacterium]|nr:MAG: hypothetical protein EON81_15645 [bacterium]